MKDEILAKNKGHSIEDELMKAMQILKILKPTPAMMGVFKVEKDILPSLPEADTTPMHIIAKIIPKISLTSGKPSEIKPASAGRLAAIIADMGATIPTCSSAIPLYK